MRSSERTMLPDLDPDPDDDEFEDDIARDDPCGEPDEDTPAEDDGEWD